MTPILLLLALLVLLVMIYQGKGFWGWVTAAILALTGWSMSPLASGLFQAALVLVIAATVIFGLKPLRQTLISGHAMKLMGKALPSLGDTEQIALKAGGVWWEGELFSGKPDWSQLLDFKVQALSETEQAFLDGPVEELCRLIDDWQISQDRDLSPEVWRFIKQNKFLGMIIPTQYGGLGFSAAAHAAVITRISSRSVTAAVTIMVPNSLGPA
ncbi:MAG: acyl-CoA dehydrogenase family protein, partial [Pseudohongiellaceae bacterium]